jgi:hypothetical protein
MVMDGTVIVIVAMIATSMTIAAEMVVTISSVQNFYLNQVKH